MSEALDSLTLCILLGFGCLYLTHYVKRDEKGWDFKTIFSTTLGFSSGYYFIQALGSLI